MNKKDNEFNSTYGSFDISKGGTYKIADTKIEGNWEYIYQNKDILLRVDQYGLAYCQANPVNDILLFKRSDTDRFSKWMVWIKSIYGVANNFSFPRTKEPLNGEITYSPEKAVYYYDYGYLAITTEIMIPQKDTRIIMNVSVENKSEKVLDLEVMPALYPFVNRTDYPMWDKPEWYNQTSVGKTDNHIEFITRLNDAYGNQNRRRLVTFHVNKDASAEIRMGNYIGYGSFDMPDSVKSKNLEFDYSSLGEAGQFHKDCTVFCYQPVYACKYNISLKEGEIKTYTQVLSMQPVEYLAVYNKNDAEKAVRFFNEEYRKKETEKIRLNFEKLFNINTVKTSDKLFDYYVNTFLPLQINWVASLDRGWPTGLRGVRDAANDFMGVMYFDESWTRKILLQLYSCQRSDGWLPRQISNTDGGKHDLRRYSDSGAFLMEFLYEYICQSGDIKILDQKIPWLDNDVNNTLFEHVKKSFDYYLDPENSGEHGLVKIYEGDWLDAANRAGIEGRGETVMVTCQLIMNLYYFAEIIEKYNKVLTKEAQNYIKRAEEFKQAVNNCAYNKKGFYNGVFNDGGKWYFSDKDEDGAERFYGPTNYYAILCGAANDYKAKKVLELSERLKDTGYRIFTPPFTKPLNYIGRIASGDQTAGMWENGTVYNHVQGFRCRALATAGEGDKLMETLRFMLPYSHIAGDDKIVLPAPYAMVNCYQDLPLAKHRAGMPFLTGAIAMAVRVVYNCLFGLKPKIDGLCISPCMPSGEKDCQVNYSFRGKNIIVNYKGDKDGFNVTLNGKEVISKRKDYLGKDLVFIDIDELEEKNVINVNYVI